MLTGCDYNNIEPRISIWCDKWLSNSKDRGLILVKAVLKSIPIFWMSIAHIPKGILDKSRKTVSVFYGSGKGKIKEFLWLNGREWKI